ncbi:MAG: MFS transporter [Alphaproteobacteria bacterium]|nr:MFS transporter [Alphaproteobacteria bacterium]
MSTRPTPWFAVAVVVAAGIVAALQVGKAAIALPLLRAELGLDLQQAGWVMSIFAVLGMIAGIPAGSAVTRFGDRQGLVAGLLAIAMGSTAGALATGFAVLLAARLFEGLGYLLVVVAAPAVLQRVAASSDRDRVFAIWSTFMPAGMAMALVTGAMLDGWRGFWFANSAFALAAALLVARAVAPRERDAAAASLRAVAADAGRTIAAGGPLLLAVAFSTYALQWFAVFSFLPILLIERMGVTVQVAGILTAIPVAANMIGNLGAGTLLGRGMPRWSLIAGAAVVMGLSGFGIFAAAAPAPVVFLLCILFSGAGGLLPGTVFASIPLLAPRPQLVPVAVGLVIHGNNLGQLVGPVAIGAIVDAAGWAAASVPVALAAAICAMAAVALAQVFRERARAG